MRRALGVSLVASIVVTAACSADAPLPNASGAGGATMSSSQGAVSSTGPGGVTLPPQFRVSGVVVDQDGVPVADALVLQGGNSTEEPLLSGADGSFALSIHYSGQGTPAVLASKEGYRTAGYELAAVPDGPLTLMMVFVTESDNEGYVYGEPGDENSPSTGFCGHCHNTLAGQFQSSGHARATRNPKLQDLYAGTAAAFANASSCLAAGGSWKPGLVVGSEGDIASKCYLGEGVLAALNPQCGGNGQPACDDPMAPAANQPTSFGACADCHAPGINGPAGGRNLHEAVGIAFENGVHCDPCHKSADIDLSKPPGAGQRLVTRRPVDKYSDAPDANIRPLMFGPLLDVANSFMGGSLQPKFSEAVFCAGCHQHNQPALIDGQTLDAARWPDGLPIHSTYDEWLAGPYNAANVPCQHCHMPEEYSIPSSADLGTPDNASITFGFPRPPEQIRAHIFRSPLQGNPRLIDTALTRQLSLSTNGSTLSVDVALGNGGCGHALPTGEPMRALVLLVEASCDGVALTPSAGMTIPDIGGSRARGTLGDTASLAGVQLSWPLAAPLAQVGDTVRVVRATGEYDDYRGIGFFADPNLTPQQKGMPVMAPVGRAQVVAISASTLTLDVPLNTQAGDVIYLGDAAAPPADGSTSHAWAGAPGYAFARILVDANGERQAPQHRAIDIASDNRIAPASASSTHHEFILPAQCNNASAKMWVVYRPHPYKQLRQLAWDSKDYLIASASAEITP